MRQISFALCAFVIAAGLWLAVMESALKHPGYAGRFAVDLLLGAQAGAGMLCVLLNGRAIFRAIALICAIVAALFGALSILLILTAAHFEAYLLIIDSALLLQGAFTAATLLRRSNELPNRHT
jgi:hypothetical protein